MTEQFKTRIIATTGALLVVGVVQFYLLQDVESVAWLFTEPLKQWVEGLSYAPNLNKMLAACFILGIVLLAAAASRHKRIRTRKDNE